MNHSIVALAHLVCPLWLPVRDPFKSVLAWCPQRVLFDETLLVVGNLLSGMTQVLHVRLGRRRKWRARGFGILMPRKLQTDEVASRRWSEELRVAERPLGSKLRVQSTEELQTWSGWE